MRRRNNAAGRGKSSNLQLGHAESISGRTEPKLAPKQARKMRLVAVVQPAASLKRISQQFSIRTSSSCRRLLFTCVILIAAAIGRAQQRELPTVIVRGFLNYRTTVDGTVLLFTPDAGQQQQPTPASAIVQARTSQVASVASSSLSLRGGGPSSVLIDTLAMAIQPTSVQLAHLATEPPRPDGGAQEPNSFRPVASTLTNSAGSAAAQSDEWHPIQATPPLRPSKMSSSLSAGPHRLNTTPSATEAQPSVQADDVAGGGQSNSRPKEAAVAAAPLEEPKPNETPIETRGTSGRLRRPSLGFSGQGLRPREGAVSSGQSRTRTESSAAAPANSINGIRRPGLTSSPTSPPSPPQPARSHPSEAPANVSSAFQSRLTNASARLRNRFKHRQPAQSGAPTPSGSPATPPETPSQDPKLERNNLVAPESLLDVSASIEQPTEAARSQALAPQFEHRAEQLAAPSTPAVGSDEPLTIVASSGADSQASPQATGTAGQEQGDAVVVPVVASNLEAEALGGNPLDLPMTAEQQAGTASLSRAGEQQPARVISGQLLQGSLSSGPLSMDNLFLSDQPAASSIADGQASSEPVPSHAARPLSASGRPMKQAGGGSASSSGNLNGKLNGWLGQHHNKFVPRPPAKSDTHSNLSHQLANNIQQLNPTQPPPPAANQTLAVVGLGNQSNASSNATVQAEPSSLSVGSLAGNGSDWLLGGNSTGSEQPTSMQTITKTYSTIMETTRTRIVPMQVDQATAIYTITEDFLMTKLMTAYQTIPAQAVFILADQQLSTRAPFEVFESSANELADGKHKSDSQPAPVTAAAAPAIAAPAAEPIETQEQPISLDNSPKSANNWLHDFSNPLEGNSNNPLTNSFNSNSLTQQDQQQQAMLALLEQQAREANFAPGFPLMSPNGEPLDQLASQLDPTALLADGAINIPDLNNPLVLAAAIQNPQLAAVILAAQQLKLKRQQQLQQKPLSLQQQPQPLLLQPSYSTSFSTTIRPSTYTARDTMYTTRLVSFRDGRTVRTRTVSEPGSVIEQVLTTMVTETIPYTITIKPTGVIGAASSPATALPNIGTASGAGGGSLGAQSNQATINNALFATQLANILARRQQQLQTSFNGPASLGSLGQGSSQVASATPQQLLALQQYLNSQQQKRQQPPAQQAQQQFQPNFQQLLQSLDNPTASTPSTTSIGQPARKPAGGNQSSNNQTNNSQQATPALQQTPKSVISLATPVPNLVSGPITTTLTSIQTRTYTVHNAFKTIFRTITSTILITTVLNAGATMMPTLG